MARELLALVCAITLHDPAGATEDDLLGRDLGVESIDLLDLLFQVEERLDVSLGEAPPFLDGAFFEASAGNLDGGRLTDAGREVLRGCVYLDPERMAGESCGAYLGSVRALVDLVVWRRASGGHP